MSLKEKDLEIYQIIENERIRQKYNIELIASENYASEEVREAQGSIFTNKYAEGYPHKRYYGGCENADALEELAIDRCCKLFNVKFSLQTTTIYVAFGISLLSPAIVNIP